MKNQNYLYKRFQVPLGLSVLLHCLVGAIFLWLISIAPTILSGKDLTQGPMWIERISEQAVSVIRGRIPPEKRTVSDINERTTQVNDGISAKSRAESASEKSVASVSGEFGVVEGVPDDLMRQIRSQIEAAKYYPALALRRRIEGVSQVKFQVDSKGLPLNIEIVQSSGSPLLDQATKTTIQRAGPFPVVSGWVTFPLNFQLERM